ncbi:PREDICTED: uncharacterized protein LOC109150431 [Ipomoea nil]|uniref:uncharacterized protein LOC109150431 n=1 Tax=Ipomoea nil TaxID=35883 RepID=UPI000901FA6F|nr:PREDICTED: uncharacterized protein LOC109150431 [Ipomoea nil]
MEEEKGQYTVNSCYKKLIGDMHGVQMPSWTKIWKLQLPPKIKVFFWQIWEARNEKIWNNVILSTHAIVSGAQSFILEWQLANHSTVQPTSNFVRDAKWERPPLGWLKLNVDAALDYGNRRMGLGFVLRDAEGTFVAAKEIPISGLFKPKEDEAIGVREALKWIKDLQYDFIQLQLYSSFDLIINDVKELAKDFLNINFLFAKRSANKVAHLLTRETLFKSDCSVYFFIPFPSIV